MKIIYPLPKHLRFVIGFNSKAQLGMQRAEALLQEGTIILGQRPRVTVIENKAWQPIIDSNRASETVHNQNALLEFRGRTHLPIVHSPMVK